MPTTSSEGLNVREERDHDLRAALFGIEASAEGLNRHREQLTPEQFDELAAGLAAEVRRLRSLLDDHGTTTGTFDLVDAIDPVVASGRAFGLDVRMSVPRGIEVIGRRDITSQVVLGLLDNARTHAPGSPVEVRASVLCGAATLYVEDRGEGIPGPSPERVFERGVRGSDSVGSGLGLCIARRLMTDQGGSISVRSRPGGGTSFALRFRRPPMNAVPSGEDRLDDDNFQNPPKPRNPMNLFNVLPSTSLRHDCADRRFGPIASVSSESEAE